MCKVLFTRNIYQLVCFLLGEYSDKCQAIALDFNLILSLGEQLNLPKILMISRDSCVFDGLAPLLGGEVDLFREVFYFGVFLGSMSDFKRVVIETKNFEVV